MCKQGLGLHTKSASGSGFHSDSRKHTRKKRSKTWRGSLRWQRNDILEPKWCRIFSLCNSEKLSKSPAFTETFTNTFTSQIHKNIRKILYSVQKFISIVRPAQLSNRLFGELSDLDAAEIRRRISREKDSPWSSFGAETLDSAVPPPWVTFKYWRGGKGKNEDVKVTTSMIPYSHSWMRGWRPGKRSIGTTEIISSPLLWRPDIVASADLWQ